MDRNFGKEVDFRKSKTCGDLCRLQIFRCFKGCCYSNETQSNFEVLKHRLYWSYFIYVPHKFEAREARANWASAKQYLEKLKEVAREKFSELTKGKDEKYPSLESFLEEYLQLQNLLEKYEKVLTQLEIITDIKEEMYNLDEYIEEKHFSFLFNVPDYINALKMSLLGSKSDSNLELNQDSGFKRLINVLNDCKTNSGANRKACIRGLKAFPCIKEDWVREMLNGFDGQREPPSYDRLKLIYYDMLQSASFKGHERNEVEVDESEEVTFFEQHPPNEDEEQVKVLRKERELLLEEALKEESLGYLLDYCRNEVHTDLVALKKHAYFVLAQLENALKEDYMQIHELKRRWQEVLKWTEIVIQLRKNYARLIEYGAKSEMLVACLHAYILADKVLHPNSDLPVVLEQDDFYESDAVRKCFRELIDLDSEKVPRRLYRQLCCCCCACKMEDKDMPEDDWEFNRTVCDDVYSCVTVTTSVIVALLTKCKERCSTAVAYPRKRIKRNNTKNIRDSNSSLYSAGLFEGEEI